MRLSFTGSYLNKLAGFFTVRVTDGLPSLKCMSKSRSGWRSAVKLAGK